MKIKDYFFTQEEFEVSEVDSGILQTMNLPDNLGKYYETEAYLSHTNSKKSIVDKVYAFVQKLNLNYKYKIVSKYNKNGKLLDYGCGNGVFLEYFKEKGYNVSGFEPNEVARNQALEKGLEVISELNENETYDIITLWHVLEHITNPSEILDILKSKLTENGKILIAVPNYKSYDAKYYEEFWAAYDVPRHVFHYSKDGAIQFFRKNDFQIEALYPMPFDSYFISLMSATYKKSIFQKILFPFIGNISNLLAYKTGNWSSLVYVLTK